MTLNAIDPGTPPTNLNEQTRYEYDALGRTTRVIAAYNTTLTTIIYSDYDRAGRVTQQYVQSLTYASHYEYDRCGRVIKVYDAQGWASNPQYLIWVSGTDHTFFKPYST